MIMFWHRRKLLEMEEQLKEVSNHLSEAVSDGFDALRQENASLQHTLDQVRAEASKLEQDHTKILELLTALADAQRTGQKTLTGIAECHRDSLIKLTELIDAQSSSVEALSGMLDQVQASLGRDRQDYAAHQENLQTALEQNRQDRAALQERFLSALGGTEAAITQKMAEQAAAVTASQDSSAKELAGAVGNVLMAIQQRQSDSIQLGSQIIGALQEAERTISDTIVGQPSATEDIAELRQKLSDQGSSLHEIDAAVKQITDGMDTLDEAMRLLLVNSLLNNFPGK